MIIKIIGAAFVVAAGMLMGITLGDRGKRQIHAISEFRRALAVIGAELQFSHNPLMITFENVAARCPEYSGFFERVALGISESLPGGFYPIWQDAVKEELRKTSLGSDELEFIEGIGHSLGYIELSLQLSALKLADDYLSDRVKELGDVAGKNQRMYRSLGVLGGLLTAIILL